MRGSGATFNALYADDSDDDSDGFGCVFPNDGAGFDTDSDGSDFSNLADDLFEKASVDSFEFDPPSNAEKAGGSSYNRAKLDMDDDAVSVGSDKDFQRASKSNKRWDWVEDDERSVGSDDDFEVQFEGRGNSVYDLKAGQGEIEDFLGGGGGEDLNEDFEFRSDFADTQRAEAFFNEGQAGDRGGVLVKTDYIPGKPGAAQRRRVDPRFIAAHGNKKAEIDPDELIPAPKSSGKSRSAALIAAGLAQAASKKGGKPGKGYVGREGEPITRTNPVTGGVEGSPSLEAVDAETDAAAKARIDRSLAKLNAALAAATDEAGRDKVEERLLSELEDIGDDVRKGIRALERRGRETDKSRVKALTDALAAIQSRMDGGLSPAGMIQAARQLMTLEHKKDQLLATAVTVQKKAAKRAAVRAEREGGDDADTEGSDERAPAPRAPVRAAGRTSLGMAGEVELISLGARKKAIKFADSEVRIDATLGLDKLQSLLAGVKAGRGGEDPAVKKEILRRVKRAISDKKLATGLRQKRAPTGFAAKAGGAGGK